MALPSWMIPPDAERISVEEYLRREAVAEFKSEYYDGYMVPLWPETPTGMVGGSAAHGALCTNLVTALAPSLGGVGCQAFTSEVKVLRADADAHLYPDLSIACGPEWVSLPAGILANPKIVFEVLSPATENRDRTTKFRMYMKVPTIAAIVLVSSDPFGVEVYARQLGSVWTREDYDDGVVVLPGGLSFDIADLTRNLPPLR